jgi:2-polyprenyl-3-methyl-5-hydroxy-6-metoxy-1,4-benzoquinol methylase
MPDQDTVEMEPTRSTATSASTAFWDELYTSAQFDQNVPIAVVRAAVAHFGSVSGKTLLEVGGGPGATSLYFGSLGANVINVEKSSKAINYLKTRIETLKIRNVRGICGDASDLAHLEPVDFVFGSMILHHLEPFHEFVAQLRRVLKPGGKAFFYENNANSRILVWFRQKIVGKFWIPKYGDQEEFPLTPDEVDELKKTFKVEIVYPEMLFFRLASTYLFKKRFRPFLGKVDEFFFRRRWMVNRSYRQYLLISG